MHHANPLLRAALLYGAALALAACAPDDTAASASTRAPAPGAAVAAAPGAVPDTAAVVEGAPSPASAATGGPPAAARPAAAPRSAAAEPRRVVLHGIDLTGIGHDAGSADAPIVVVDFSDFGCPYCGMHARGTLPAIEEEFIRTGKVFYKQVPIVMGFPKGDLAARAAECAAEQGAFWPMHDVLYATQPEWRGSRAPHEIFLRAAAGLGLDAARLSACYRGEGGTARTARANDAAFRLGIRATPTFFVNGRQIEGALPLAQFRLLLAGAP